MAQDSLRDFTMNAVLASLLLSVLLSFAIGFMYYNNPNGLNDGTNEIFSSSYANNSNYLQEIDTSSNSLLNITSNTNPEVSNLGSRDSVATSFAAFATPKSTWNNFKLLFSWVFTGTTGKLLIGVLGGLISLLGVFLISKFIRQGY